MENGFADFFFNETNDDSLAIDERNTINLQRAIDQFYDGDPTLSQLYNGDIHSMQ